VTKDVSNSFHADLPRAPIYVLIVVFYFLSSIDYTWRWKMVLEGFRVF